MTPRHIQSHQCEKKGHAGQVVHQLPECHFHFADPAFCFKKRPWGAATDTFSDPFSAIRICFFVRPRFPQPSVMTTLTQVGFVLLCFVFGLRCVVHGPISKLPQPRDWVSLTLKRQKCQPDLPRSLSVVAFSVLFLVRNVQLDLGGLISSPRTCFIVALLFMFKDIQSSIILCTRLNLVLVDPVFGGGVGVAGGGVRRGAGAGPTVDAGAAASAPLRAAGRARLRRFPPARLAAAARPQTAHRKPPSCSFSSICRSISTIVPRWIGSAFL